MLETAIKAAGLPHPRSPSVRKPVVHVQNGGWSGHGKRPQFDVSMLDWFVVTAERIPGKSYRWYVNGKLYKQVLAPEACRRKKRRPSQPS